MQKIINEVIENAIGASTGEGLWYFSMASGACLFCYVFFRSALRHRRVSRDDPTAKQVSREILHSLRSIAIFGVVWGLTVLVAPTFGVQIFRGRDQGTFLFIISIALMIVIHDTYFYWTHRIMHHRRLYRLFHRTHHLSTSPTP